MGTTLPCSTGFASIGVLRLGKSAGSVVCSAVPRVCGSRVPDADGVTNACTTRKWPDVGSEAQGEEGRYIFRGIWRSGAP